MENTILRLDVIQAQEISLIDSGNAYSSGKRKEENKTFSRFRFDGTVFTVPDESPFVTAYNEGKLASVKLVKGVRTVSVTDADGNSEDVERPTLQLDGFTTMVQDLNAALHQMKSSSIKQMSLKVTDLTAETLESILSATVV